MGAPRYDDTESDETEYTRLVKDVASDVAEFKTLRRDTFTRILHWKSPRVKGKIDWVKYQDYLDTIEKCISAPESDKLELLANLPGIGVPVASTIVHFLFPDRFPIIDVRTVEVLHKFGLLLHTARDLNRYPAYMGAILEIQSRNNKWNLRQIDRALFAYHKKNFPSLGGSRKSRSC